MCVRASIKGSNGSDTIGRANRGVEVLGSSRGYIEFMLPLFNTSKNMLSGRTELYCEFGKGPGR